MEIGRVVELISRLRDQHLVVGQRNSILVVDVARQQQVRPAIEHHAQLAPRGGDIIAAKRMVRMLEVADETVPDAARERDRPHHSVAFERPAHPRVRAKLSEVSGCEMGGRLEVIGGRAGDEVHRPADRVASIQRALRPSKHFDALQIEKPRERHRRPSEVDAVEIHRRTRIRSGKHHVCTDPADRELAPAGVLRKRHRGGQRRRPFNGLGSQAAEIGLRDGSDRDGNLLNIAPARLCGRDDRLFHEGDSQGEGHGDPFARPHAHGTTLPLESAQFCGDLVVAFRKVWKREVARGAGFRRAVRDTPNRHANAWQRGTGLVDDGTGQPLPRTVRLWNRPRTRAPGPQRATISWFDGRCISLHRANDLVASHTVASCARPARVADSHAWR